MPHEAVHSAGGGDHPRLAAGGTRRRTLRLLRLGQARMAQVHARVRRLPADQQELRGSLTMNGYNFTERVRKVLAMAREEAARLRHEYVGTEHILLCLIREGEGVAATVLQNQSD